MTVLHSAAPSRLPDLPLMCLKTADDTKSTANAFQGQNTVIDFWTTKCTRCPDALDKMDAMAQDTAKYRDTNFVSICCDKLDGAREILERDEKERWNHVSHYYMEHVHKEYAKKYFGFSSVPYYVVVNADGDIVQHGSSKDIDFEDIPGIVRQQDENDNKQEVEPSTAKKSEAALPVQEQLHVERVFNMDDDF